MSKVLVLYYSSYGHIEAMAEAIAEGARSAGATADVKRVPETVPEAIAAASHFKLDQAAPIATVADLEAYDAIIVGTGTRYRPHVLADGLVSRPDRRPVDARRAERQGRRCVHLHRQPAWRPGGRPCSRSSPTCCTSA